MFVEMIQFDKHIFQMGWFNHQLAKDLDNIVPETLPSQKGKDRLPTIIFSRGYVDTVRGVGILLYQQTDHAGAKHPGT